MKVSAPGGIHVFLDTSVLVAAALSERGPARAIFVLSRHQAIDAVVSEEVIGELKDVVQKKFKAEEALFAQFLLEFKPETISSPTMEQMMVWKGAIEDDDLHVLAAAANANVGYLITHDVKDFKGKKVPKALPFKIVTPGEFLGELKQG